MSYFSHFRSLGKAYRPHSSTVPRLSRNPGLLTQHPGRTGRRVEVCLGSLVESALLLRVSLALLACCTVPREQPGPRNTLSLSTAVGMMKRPVIFNSQHSWTEASSKPGTPGRVGTTNTRSFYSLSSLLFFLLLRAQQT